MSFSFFKEYIVDLESNPILWLFRNGVCLGNLDFIVCKYFAIEIHSALFAVLRESQLFYNLSVLFKEELGIKTEERLFP
jgi:hypothetical protein